LLGLRHHENIADQRAPDEQTNGADQGEFPNLFPKNDRPCNYTLLQCNARPRRLGLWRGSMASEEKSLAS
jgi:hypothetical protein